MNKTVNTPLKPTTQMNKFGSIQSSLIKTVNPAKNRLQTCDLFEDIIVGSGLTPYSEFSVEMSGYYTISNQFVSDSQVGCECSIIQHGICLENKDDFVESLQTLPQCTIATDSFIASNLSTIKFLTAGEKYIAWFNIIVTAGEMQYRKEYSKLQLIKI